MLLLLWFAPRHDPDGREKRFLDVPQRQDLVRVFFFWLPTEERSNKKPS